ncbi:hypothetical protein IWW47_004921, partial [Coemansia sp. RSA 2052]
KNLLSLGEDRYLTTLMMKHFPQFKLKFIQDAKCKTIAPEKWAVLMSQRRRWINSTIHNLAELMFLPDMCGFCCFSMRFVVFLDLFGTITMPTTLFYFAYLIYVAVTGLADVGYISLILIGAIYGVQAIIFILRREWQHIGWMLIYLLAYPLWSCILPIYSFWHMDDFSWGNTRVVVGDGKRKIIIKDDKPFDPESIPQRRWSEYEADLAVAGVLNAPPPNMNPLADSSREDDRGTMFSRVSAGGAGGAGSRYGGAHTPGPTMARAGTPTTIISGSGSVADPRLQLSTPVAQAQQQQQYQSLSRPASAAAVPSTMQQQQKMMLDGTVMANRAVSYYQQHAHPQQHSPGAGGFLDGTSGATMGVHSAMSPGGIDYFQSQGMQQQQQVGTLMPSGGAPPQHQRESLFSTSSYGVPSMYVPQQISPSSAALQGGGMPGMMMTGAMPSDEQLVVSIRRILRSQDLNTVTKKSVRTQLASEYGMDLASRKEFIGDAIQLILAGQL